MGWSVVGRDTVGWINCVCAVYLKSKSKERERGEGDLHTGLYKDWKFLSLQVAPLGKDNQHALLMCPFFCNQTYKHCMMNVTSPIQIISKVREGHCRTLMTEQQNISNGRSFKVWIKKNNSEIWEYNINNREWILQSKNLQYMKKIIWQIKNEKKLVI